MRVMLGYVIILINIDNVLHHLPQLVLPHLLLQPDVFLFFFEGLPNQAPSFARALHLRTLMINDSPRSLSILSLLVDELLCFLRLYAIEFVGVPLLRRITDSEAILFGQTVLQSRVLPRERTWILLQLHGTVATQEALEIVLQLFLYVYLDLMNCRLPLHFQLRFPPRHRFLLFKLDINRRWLLFGAYAGVGEVLVRPEGVDVLQGPRRFLIHF